MSFRFVSCILVDWSFHLPIWATGFQKRKMSAVITGHFKRSSSSWISYFSSWGTLPAQMWASFLFIVYSYLPPFSLMSPSSKTASLHNWLGQLAKKVTLLSSTGLFLNKIFRELRLCLQKIKIHSIRCIFFLRQLIQLCKILDRFNQSLRRDWFYLDHWSPVLSVIFFPQIPLPHCLLGAGLRLPLFPKWLGYFQETIIANQKIKECLSYLPTHSFFLVSFA